MINIELLSGHISFDDTGKRKNYTLDVVEMTVTSQMVNIGRWSEEEGLILSGGANGAARYRPSNRKLASVFLTTLSWG